MYINYLQLVLELLSIFLAIILAKRRWLYSVARSCMPLYAEGNLRSSSLSSKLECSHLTFTIFVPLKNENERNSYFKRY
jgi:hypothetical protein